MTLLPFSLPFVRPTLCSLLLYLLTAALPAATYYVAPTGSDFASGAASTPWATPHHAVTQAQAGDTVYFRAGVYALEARLEPRISGTAEAWITFAGYPGEEVWFDGTDFIPASGQHDRGLVDVIGPAYLRFVNLRVRESHVMGFHARGPSHHIEFIECVADETFGPGFGIWNADAVRVLHCEAVRNTTNRKRLYGDFAQEAPHEAISMAGASNFEVAYNHVHHGDKEGIDVKEVSRYGRVHHNYVHDMPRQGLYVDAWFGNLHHIEFDHNIVHDCEWGMGISVEHAGSTLNNVSVHHNLFHDMRGSGIYFTTWGGGPRSDVDIFNNTFFRCGKQAHWSGATGSIDLRSPNLRRIRIFNNLCTEGGAYEIATFDDPAVAGLDLLEAQEIYISHNQVPVDTDLTNRTWPSGYGRNYVWSGDSLVRGVPGFVDAEARVFYLVAEAAARDQGWTDATAIPQATADLGCFAYGLDQVPDPAPTLERVLDRLWRVVQPTVHGRHYTLQRSADLNTWTPAKTTEAVGHGLPDITYVRQPLTLPLLLRSAITPQASP